VTYLPLKYTEYNLWNLAQGANMNLCIFGLTFHTVYPLFACH